MKKNLWTEEEVATLREICTTLPPGGKLKAALLRRLPGRTHSAIKNQIRMLGLAHPEKPPKRRVRDPGTSGKIYECLTRHGPLSVPDLAELMGLPVHSVTNCVGHLVRRSAIVPEGPRPHRWAIAAHPPGPVRRNTRPAETAGITTEDLEWMRRYREQRERRLRQGGEQRCS